MIRMWKQDKGLKEITSFERNCWIEVSNPTDEEIEMIKRDYRVPEDFISDALDVDERSRTELDGRWLLIIMRVPLYLPDEDIPYITLPLGVMISVNSIITICAHSNEVGNPDLLQRIKGFNIENKHNFILNLLFRSATYYLRYLKDINKLTSTIEDELRRSTRNHELIKLLKVEKSLVYFITSLKSNEILIAKLQNSKIVNVDLIDQGLLEDVIIENRQASEMARIYSDILSGLMDAFASVISNNLNVVMKQLTSITIILMIPTLVASLFGMNVPNHWENNHYGFLWAILISLGLAVVGVLFFRKRDMF